ncbi:MAG: hypothetical protein ABIP79_08230 [Chitinophagaceae bacterium]
MKKIIFLTLSVLFLFACVKKKAIKYDPEMEGTWVGKNGNTCYWFKVDHWGKGEFRTYKSVTDDRIISGTVKYSVFELKMWVGTTKFKNKEWLTGDMKGIDSVKTKDYASLRDTTYSVDRRMVIKTNLANSSDLITMCRIRQY